MLCRNLVAGQCLDICLCPNGVATTVSALHLQHTKKGNLHVTHSNHAHRLPNAQTNARGNTPVQTHETVGLVNVPERVTDRHLLGTVGIVLLALHLDADHLDRLVPSRETTTYRRGANLLQRGQLLAVLLARRLADALLGETAETETRAPVGHLADGHGVDALVDAADAFLAVDVHEGGPRTRSRLPRCRQLVLGDLHRLHARAETHGRIRLRNTTRHAADDTATELAGAETASIVLGLRGDEQQDSALGRSLNPGPRDESLVDCRHPDGSADRTENRGRKRRKHVQPNTPPRFQMRPRAEPKPSPR